MAENEEKVSYLHNATSSEAGRPILQMKINTFLLRIEILDILEFIITLKSAIFS